MKMASLRWVAPLLCGVASAYTQADAWKYQSSPMLTPVSDTTSAIPHKGCVTPDPRGYLLYLAFGQQFNNQLISIAENMLLARQLGRVLVLTGFLEQVSAKKTSDGKDYFDTPRVLKPFEMAFEKNASMEGNGFHAKDVITMEEFQQLCPNQDAYPNAVAQAHVFLPDWEPDLWEKGYYLAYNSSYYLPQHMYECCQNRCCGPYSVPNTCSDCGQHGWNNRWNGALAKQLPMFREVWQIAHGHDHVLQLSSMPSGLQVPVVIFDGLYYKFNNTYPRYAKGSDAIFEVVRHFVWNSSVSDRAKGFTDRKFGGRPYIAIHWRRGFSGGSITIRTMSEVIGLLRKVSDEYRDNSTSSRLPDIYIASNELTTRDLDMIRTKLNMGQVVASLVLEEESNDLDLNALSRVEMAICQRSLAFISAPGSTWSMNVNALRGTTKEHFSAVGRELDERIAVRREARKAAVEKGKLASTQAEGSEANAETEHERDTHGHRKMPRRDSKPLMGL